MPGAGGEDCGRKRAMSDRKEKLTYLIGNQTPERAPRRRPIAGRRLEPSPEGEGGARAAGVGGWGVTSCRVWLPPHCWRAVGRR